MDEKSKKEFELKDRGKQRYIVKPDFSNRKAVIVLFTCPICGERFEEIQMRPGKPRPIMRCRKCKQAVTMNYEELKDE